MSGMGSKEKRNKGRKEDRKDRSEVCVSFRGMVKSGGPREGIRGRAGREAGTACARALREERACGATGEEEAREVKGSHVGWWKCI